MGTRLFSRAGPRQRRTVACRALNPGSSSPLHPSSADARPMVPRLWQFHIQRATGNHQRLSRWGPLRRGGGGAGECNSTDGGSDRPCVCQGLGGFNRGLRAVPLRLLGAVGCRAVGSLPLCQGLALLVLCSFEIHISAKHPILARGRAIQAQVECSQLACLTSVDMMV